MVYKVLPGQIPKGVPFYTQARIYTLQKMDF